MALTFDKINDLTGVKGVIGTDLLGSSRIRDDLSIGKNLTVTEKISLNGAINGSSVLDDSIMEETSSTTISTSASVKAYVDNLTGVTLPSATYVITVDNDIFKVDGVEQDTLTLTEGGTYIFDISANTNVGHDFKLSLTSDGTHKDGVEYTEGVSSTGSSYSSGYSGSTASAGTTGSNIKFIVPFGLYATNPTIYYYCGNHAAIGGNINIKSSSLDGTIKAYVDAQVDTADTLSEMTDTMIASSPADNELLAYDSTASKWINQTAAEAGILELAGGTMTGNITMGDNRILGADRIGFTDGGLITQMLDSDTMSGAGSTIASSSESIKAYVDATAAPTSNAYSTTLIKVMPTEFMVNDDYSGRAANMIEDDTVGYLGYRVGSTLTEAYAFVHIPNGYKATHCRVSASASTSSAVDCLTYNYTTGAIATLASGSFDFNTNSNISDITATTTNDMVIKITPANVATIIYGADVTIAAV